MVKVSRFLDKFFGRMIVFFLGFLEFFEKKRYSVPKKFLIVKPWAIGDSVLSLVIAKAIKENFPKSKIDALTRKRPADVFQSCEFIDDVYLIDNLKDLIKIFSLVREYDVVFDCDPYLNISAIFSFILGRRRVGFANQFRSRLYDDKIKFSKKEHMVQNYLEMVRALDLKFDTKELVELKVSKKERKKVDVFLKKNKIKKSDFVVGITPGVAETVKARMWFENRFSKLADKLIEKERAKILFIDGPNNKDVVEKILKGMKNKAINSLGKFSLRETFYLIGVCDVYISNDTGPVHIAAAQGCKTIGLYGPNTPVLWGPYGKKNIAIYKTELPPSIDNLKGVFKEGNREEYMGPITVKDVYKAVKKLKR